MKKKYISLMIFLAGLLSLQCGLQASPAIAAFLDEARPFPLVDLSVGWLTLGALGIIIGGLGILLRQGR